MVIKNIMQNICAESPGKLHFAPALQIRYHGDKSRHLALLNQLDHALIPFEYDSCLIESEVANSDEQVTSKPNRSSNCLIQTAN